MAKAVSFTKTGQKQGTSVELDEAVFGVKPNPEVLALVDRAYLANLRQAGARTLTRGGVSGGGKKPWRQKGTGRARAGSSRLPHWRGGGVAFGPTGLENFKLDVPSKVKQQAIRQALSIQAKANRILILESLETEGKTGAAFKVLKKLDFSGNALLVLPEANELVERATRNITNLHVLTAKYLSTHQVLSANWIIITRSALEVLSDWLASKPKPALKNENPSTAKSKKEEQS